MPQPSRTASRIATLICLALCIAAPALGAGEEFCRGYANQAIEQFEIGRAAGCRDLNFPRWSADFDHHYNWCRTAPEAEAYKGTEDRAAVLESCGAMGQAAGVVTGVGVLSQASEKERTCAAYADTAVRQQQLNVSHGCNLSGPPWNPNRDDHYRWCMGLGDLRPAHDGERMRRAALEECGVASGTPPGQATPLPIPGSVVRGAVERAALPLPLPRPALDPGLGDNTPSNVDLQAVAQRVSVPPSRAALVNALLADAVIRSQLQALPNVVPQNLAFQTLGGASVTAAVSAAGSPAQTAGLGGNIAPSSGPALPSGIDWHAGIQFTPFAPSPVYYLAGERKTLGTVLVDGVVLSYESLSAMNRNRVVPAGNKELGVALYVALPNETATYLVTFGLASPAGLDPASYRGPEAPIRAYSPELHSGPLTLAPTSNGLVTILTVRHDPTIRNDHGRIAHTAIYLSAPSGLGVAFGGITLTRL